MEVNIDENVIEDENNQVFHLWINDERENEAGRD